VTVRVQTQTRSGRPEPSFSPALICVVARESTEDRMKWMQMYLVGYVIMLGGVVAGLWKMGVLARVGAGWTAIGIVIAPRSRVGTS